MKATQPPATSSATTRSRPSAGGKSEWTIAGVLKAANRVFKFAARRMGWHGANPVAGLDEHERPRLAAAPRRRIYSHAELRQTLAAAREPYRTLFALAAVTGARLSELLGLTWAELSLEPAEEAAVRFGFQVDRRGRRQPLKTDASRRTIELPAGLADALASHQLRSPGRGPDGFVFATRSGRPLLQRNVTRALRAAQRRARDEHGQPSFPGLHRLDGAGRPLPPPQGSLPSFHSFRHTAASRAIAAGESAEEVAWQLGHRSATVTRSVYIHELKTAERLARRRQRLEAAYGQLLEPRS